MLKERLTGFFNALLGDRLQIQFLLQGSIYFVSLQIVYFKIVVGSDLYFSYLKHLAYSAGSLMRLFGVSAKAYGQQLIDKTSNDYVVVVQGCDALLLFSAMVAAMLAYPASLVHKAWGLVVGLSLLYVLNIFRIAGMLWVEINFPELFELFHYYLFSIALWLAIIAIFVGWVGFVERAGKA